MACFLWSVLAVLLIPFLCALLGYDPKRHSFGQAVGTHPAVYGLICGLYWAQTAIILVWFAWGAARGFTLLWHWFTSH